MSLKVIQKIKANHDNNCGTSNQLKDNLTIIKSELDILKKEEKKLKIKEKMLLDVEAELYNKIEEFKNN